MVVHFEDSLLVFGAPTTKLCSTVGKGVCSLRVGEQGNYVVRIWVLIFDRANISLFVQLAKEYKSEGYL